MKKITLLVIAFALTLNLNAQTETLFGGVRKIGGFGGPMIQMAAIDGDFALYNGGGGAAIINGKFFVGGFGMSVSNQHLFDYQNVSHELDLGYGGLWLGYIYRPTKLVHLNFSLPLGGGGLNLNNVLTNQDAFADDSFFLINPSIGAELNLTTWMKVALNAGYLLYTGIDNAVVTAEDLNSPSAFITFKFGYFAE